MGGIFSELLSNFSSSDFIPPFDIILETSFAHSVTVNCFIADTLGTLISCCSCDVSMSISESTLDAIIVKSK